MSGARGPPLEELVDEGDPDELFELIDEIAQGSYGHVFNAVFLPKSSPCALKIIALEEDETFDDLKVEIAILKRCEHHKIVQYFGSWQKGTELFIAMELCDGASIDRLQETVGRGLNETELMTITKDSLLGLEYLHKMHTLHRDIKSANLLVNTRGECKLVDFGVCVISEPGQKRMTFIGSPYWMAPEVIDNRTLPSPYGPKCDVWSLGVTLLEMADNCVPLSELQPMVALRQIPSRDPPTLKEPDNWSQDFKDFLAKCLQKDPDDRYDTTQLQQMNWLVSKPIGPKCLQELVKSYLTEVNGEAPEIPDLPPADAAQGEAPSTPGPADTPASPRGALSPRAPPEDPKTLAAEVEARTDIDETEKALLLANLEESQKKNRPTSLRRSIREQDKFVAQVKNAEAVKEQLKQAKKAQQKQEAATKAKQKSQQVEKDKLLKSKNGALDKAKSSEAGALKTLNSKSSADMDKLRKAESAAAKNMDKALGVEQKDMEKRFAGQKSGLLKQVKDSQSKRTKGTFSNNKKGQLKNKNTKKAMGALHKEQDKEWSGVQDANLTKISNMLQAHQKDLEVTLKEFHTLRTQNSETGWKHLTHLREVQLVQRKGLLQLEGLMKEQAIELEFHKKEQEMDLEHLKNLHSLRVEQTVSGNKQELENHKVSADKEFKRLMRVHKNEAKDELKKWKKNVAGTMKGAKAEIKQRTQVEQEKMQVQQKTAEDKYKAELEETVQKDEKALLEYQADSESRLKDFQEREMNKAIKDAEKKNEELLEAQAKARADLRKKITVEALTMLFTHIRAELEALKQIQSDDIVAQARWRKDRSDARTQAGLESADADEAWQQKKIDQHKADQETLLADQKAQFVEVYGKSDELAETIWSWRNSEDLATKLDEVVPAAPCELQSAEELAKELADLQSRQDTYRETQEGQIAKNDETVKAAQTAKIDDLFASEKAEAEGLAGEIDKDEEAKLGAFCVAAEAVQ